MLAALACATPSTPFEGHPVLAAIKFEGNNSVSSGDLLSKMATAPTSGFFSKTPHYYDVDLFALDQKRIIRWYNEKGFYEAKIADVKDPRDDRGRVTLVVRIDEGRRAIVRTMDFAGLRDLRPGEFDKINEALPIHTGDGFDEDAYNKAKTVLQDQLKEHGFAQVKVSGRVEVMPLEGAAHLWLTVALGPRFTFGKVIVTGTRKLPADQIAYATGIRKGNQFKPSALELAQQRVYSLGTFSGVRVGLEPLGNTPVASVRVNVREAPFQTVRTGIGGEINAYRWELPRLHAEYAHRALFGGFRRLDLSSTVGYAFVPTLFNVDVGSSGFVTSNSAQITVSNVLIPGLDAVVRGEFAREVQFGYSYDDVAARFALPYRLGRHSIALSLNFVRYFDARLGIGLDQLLARAGQSAGILQDCPTACTLTYPELRYTYDGRDNAIEPLEGFYGTIGLQQTLKPGSFSYFRIEPEIRFYRPVVRFVTLATRAYFGALVTEAGPGSPFTQRFFGGGQNLNRGYAPLQQGPKVGAAPNAAGFATVAVPIGGKGTLLVTGELRIRTDFLLNHLGFALFVDASRVDALPSAPWTGSGLEVAPGVGLRYITPFGPVRFDVGWVLNPKDVIALGSTSTTGAVVVLPTVVSAFCHGQANCINQTRWAYHLTLGEAF